MNTLLPLLNPAGNLTVEKAMEIAELMHECERRVMGERAKLPRPNDHNSYRASYKYWHNVAKILQSYETFKQKKLSKEMFCVDEHAFTNPMDGEQDIKMYELAQSKVIFEGFEITGNANPIPHQSVWLNDHLFIQFSFVTTICHTNNRNTVESPTIGDLFTEIERYNRTATSKIELKFTPNILKELGL